MTNEMLVEPREPEVTSDSAREELSGCLDNFRLLSEEISSYEALCRASEAAEAEALANHSLPEEDAVELIARAQARKHVHEARIAKKHEQLKVSATKLETALTAATNALRGECLAVLEQKRAVLAEAVLKVLGLPITRVWPHGVGLAVGNSPRVRAIEDCRPLDSNAIGHLPIEQRALDVLSKFERLEKERSV